MVLAAILSFDAGRPPHKRYEIFPHSCLCEDNKIRDTTLHKIKFAENNYKIEMILIIYAMIKF